MTVHRQKTTVQKFFGYRQQKYASMNVNENSEGDGNMLYRIACCDDEQQILDRLKECFVRLEVQTDIETPVSYTHLTLPTMVRV